MNILLIEDSDLIAQMLYRLLKKRGHTVYHVVGIGAAVDMVVDLREGDGVELDMVITDREVVGGDAWEFVKGAMETGQLPEKAIFMSGRPTPNPPRPFYHKGADSILAFTKILEEAGA